MPKSPDAFRTISEVADWLGVQAHVLRFWESKFAQVKPVKRAGGRRYYRPTDMLLLGGIKKLLHDDGMTIKGVQKVLREQGIAHVSDLSGPLDDLTMAVIEGNANTAARAEAPTEAKSPMPTPEGGPEAVETEPPGVDASEEGTEDQATLPLDLASEDDGATTVEKAPTGEVPEPIEGPETSEGDEEVATDPGIEDTAPVAPDAQADVLETPPDRRGLGPEGEKAASPPATALLNEDRAADELPAGAATTAADDIAPEPAGAAPPPESPPVPAGAKEPALPAASSEAAEPAAQEVVRARAADPPEQEALAEQELASGQAEASDNQSKAGAEDLPDPALEESNETDAADRSTVTAEQPEALGAKPEPDAEEDSAMKAPVEPETDVASLSEELPEGGAVEKSAVEAPADPPPSVAGHEQASLPSESPSDGALETEAAGIADSGDTPLPPLEKAEPPAAEGEPAAQGHATEAASDEPPPVDDAEAAGSALDQDATAPAEAEATTIPEVDASGADAPADQPGTHPVPDTSPVEFAAEPNAETDQEEADQEEAEPFRVTVPEVEEFQGRPRVIDVVLPVVSTMPAAPRALSALAAKPQLSEETREALKPLLDRLVVHRDALAVSDLDRAKD